MEVRIIVKLARGAQRDRYVNTSRGWLRVAGYTIEAMMMVFFRFV